MRPFALLVALLVMTGISYAGDPLRVYKTVETDHFIIYYWEPLDDVARRVGVVSERAHQILSPALDHVPHDKTLIFLVDDTDDANGFAGVLPRNAIQLDATSPNGFTELDDYDDWLFGLVAHEYTHILHLDTMSGAPTIYNTIFGKTWAPNQIMPRWVIEGIAVYEESKRSAGGRNRGTFFDEYIRIARHANKDLRLDEVSGTPRQFPRGNAAYVYGSHFLQYVFDRFGDDKLRQMSHISGGYAPPFAINRQIAKVVGKPFTELYDDWKLHLRDRYGMQEMAAEKRGLRIGRALTHSAESNFWAHYSADGKWLYWVQNDGYSLNMVRAMPVGKDVSAAKDIVQIDAMGPYDLLPNGSLVYEQGRTYRRDYSFEDLFWWDASTNITQRLTTGKRARDPAVSPDGRHVAFSLNGRSESELAVMDLAPGAHETVVWHGARWDNAYQPAWSPDGKRIAFSAWRTGGYRDILIVDVATRKVEEVTHDRAIDMEPAWSSDGKLLYFDSNRTGITNIFAYEVDSKTLWQVSNVLGGAYQPHPSPDGTRVAFSALVPAGGYDLFELPVDRSMWLAAHDYIDDKPEPAHIADDAFKVSAPRPYRALETLSPQTWTLSVDPASSTALINTGGGDAAGLHSYSLGIGLDYDAGDADVGASYSYSGWRPSFFVAGARSSLLRGGWRIDGVSKTFKEEDWSGTVGLGIPLESRPDSHWTASFDYDVDWFRLVTPPIGSQVPDPNQRVPVVPVTNYLEAGVAARVAFSSVRSWTFALGPTTGFDASVSLRLDDPAFGSAYHNVTLSYAFDRYVRLWGISPVLAIRLQGALRAGDLVRPGGFSLGGVPAQDVAMSIVNSVRTSSIGFLRGYPPGTVGGNQYDLLNLEYRQELWQIEHGLATLPVYVRRLHLGVLSDIGTAYDTAFDANKNLRASVGAALRVDAFFGYFVPGTFELGYAHGLTAGGVSETWFLLTGSL
jgi:Tol biopolymer transport system component